MEKLTAKHSIQRGVGPRGEKIVGSFPENGPQEEVGALG